MTNSQFLLAMIVSTMCKRPVSTPQRGSAPFDRPIIALALAAFLVALVGSPEAGQARSRTGITAQVDTTEANNRHSQRLLIRGLTEVQLGDYKEAIDLFESAVARAPESATILSALAEAYAKLGEPTSALFYARQAREYGKHRPYYSLRLAELQQQAGAPTAALKTYRALVATHPDNLEAHEELAQLQVELGQPRAALATYEELISLHPSPPADIHRQRLALYEQLGDRRGAVEALEALVELRPNSDDYRRRLAKQYREQGAHESAHALLEPLAEAHPDDEALQRELESVSRRVSGGPGSRPSRQESGPKDSTTAFPSSLIAEARSAVEAFRSESTGANSASFETAESLLNQAINRSPESVEALSLLAELYEFVGRYGEAAALLERAVDQDPRSAERWVRVSTAFYRAGQYEKALRLTEEGLLLFPGRQTLMASAGRSALAIGDAGQAIDFLQGALADASQSADIAALKADLGRALEDAGRPHEAAQRYEEALAQDPDHAGAAGRYAYLLAREERELNRALDLAEQAVQSTNASQRSLHALGWVRFKQDKLGEARSALQKALQAGTPTTRLLEDYGDLQKALGNDAAAREYWKRALKKDPDRRSLREKLGPDPST